MRCDTSYSWQLLAAAFVMALPAAQAMAADRPVSFVNDVMPVLTKSGCNMGICHAKAGGGQNGFQLSLTDNTLQTFRTDDANRWTAAILMSKNSLMHSICWRW